MHKIQFNADETGNTNEVIGSLKRGCTMEALFTCCASQVRLTVHVWEDVEADDRFMNVKAVYGELRYGERCKGMEKKQHSLRINHEKEKENKNIFKKAAE